MKLVRIPSTGVTLDSVINISRAIEIFIVRHTKNGGKWVNIVFRSDHIVSIDFTDDANLSYFHMRLLEIWGKSLDFVQGYDEMDKPGGIIDLAAELENLVQPPN